MKKINGEAVERALLEGHILMNWGKDEPVWHAVASMLVMVLCALMLFK